MHLFYYRWWGFPTGSPGLGLIHRCMEKTGQLQQTCLTYVVSLSMKNRHYTQTEALKKPFEGWNIGPAKEDFRIQRCSRQRELIWTCLCPIRWLIQVSDD